MSLSIYNYFLLVVDFIYSNIFHEKISDDVVHFFKNMAYIGFGTFIGTTLIFIFNVLVGRLLGPQGYGEFNLVQSIGMFLFIPMILGYNNAMVKYIAGEEKLDGQRIVITTTYILVLIFTIISVLIYLMIPQKILEYFSVPSEIFHLSIAFAITYTLYTLLYFTLNGLYEIKKLAKITPLYSFILLFTFLYFVYVDMLSYKSAIFSMLFAYLITSSFMFISDRKYFAFKFDKSRANILTKFAIYSIMGNLAFILYTNINQIFINMYMSTRDLGIYNAYSFSSVNIAALFFNIFNNVFFPVVSKSRDKTIFLQRINKFTPYLIGFGIPFMVLIEFIVLNIYGKAYGINIPLMISFAIVSILTIYYGIYNWTFISEGMIGVKIANKSSILIAIINIILAVYFIPRIGTIGATISTNIALITGIYFLIKRKEYLHFDKI